MGCHDYDITFPDNACGLDQDEEYIILKEGNGREKVFLHDYQNIYTIPGLYEAVLYKRLKCRSPEMLCTLLGKAMQNHDDHQREPLRVLDFGAGNGVAGQNLKIEFRCKTMVGVDILDEAKEAALRDRPELYDEYMVSDFTDLDSQEKATLEAYNFNTLLSVAALGYDHIGTKAFLNAFDLVSANAWVAFNIKDLFLSNKDSTGFRETIRSLMQDRLHVFELERYVHRLSIAEEPLHYIGVVGKKNE
jgi:predicted TPR repeat methyltransferase